MELSREPEYWTVGGELDTKLGAMILAAKDRPAIRFDGPKAEAGGELDHGICKVLVCTCEFAATSDVVDITIGVHQPLEQGETLIDVGLDVGRRHEFAAE